MWDVDLKSCGGTEGEVCGKGARRARGKPGDFFGAAVNVKIPTRGDLIPKRSPYDAQFDRL